MTEIPESADDLEPYTPYQIEVLQRKINKRLMQINREQRHNNTEWAAAKEALLRKREPAVIQSYRDDPKAPKWVHDAAAAAACVDEDATAFAWERVVRSLNDEAHNLRQIQSSLQTLYKSLAGEAGLAR